MRLGVSVLLNDRLEDYSSAGILGQYEFRLAPSPSREQLFKIVLDYYLKDKEIGTFSADVAVSPSSNFKFEAYLLGLVKRVGLDILDFSELPEELVPVAKETMTKVLDSVLIEKDIFTISEPQVPYSVGRDNFSSNPDIHISSVIYSDLKLSVEDVLVKVYESGLPVEIPKESVQDLLIKLLLKVGAPVFSVIRFVLTREGFPFKHIPRQDFVRFLKSNRLSSFNKKTLVRAMLELDVDPKDWLTEEELMEAFL